MDLVASLDQPIGVNWSWNKPAEMNFPNIPTPPSSNEDSPQPLYFVASPGSNYFKNDDSLSAPHHVYTQVPTNPMMAGFNQTNQPYLEFIEQPTDKFRFRYKSEMAGTHGSLNGQNSDKTRKQTFPTVELINCPQKAIVRCSIYQINSHGQDLKPHAHRLIKKYGKEEVDDPHDIEVGPDEGYQAIFHSMGIIHTAKKHIVSELLKKKTALKMEMIAREENIVRVLKKTEEVELKQEAESESKSINLNIVCLRFDAFIKKNNILYPICAPIYSHGINNLKSALTGELKIVRMDHCTSPAKGNREIFLLVERVTKKNIRIRFFELNDEDQEVWEDYGKFTDLDVHHQYAIVFKTPPYKDLNITSKVKVFIELLRPSDGAKSECKEFTYTPCENMYRPGGKRSRPYASSSYDSSNLPSDEIPTTVNYLDTSWKDSLNSKELQTAINDVDSDAFDNLFQIWNPILQSNSVYNSSGNIKLDGIGTRSIQQMSLVSKEQEHQANDVIREVRNCLKSNPSEERIQKLIYYYFGEDLKSNALHTFILCNNNRSVIYIINLIYKYCNPRNTTKPNLFDIRNSDGETYLHLSVRCNNEVFTRTLLSAKANPLIENLDEDTPLHVACKHKTSINIMVFLIKYLQNNLDVTNNNGDTPLIIAIDNKRMEAIKLLLNNGADVNKSHNSNGYTPLRFAIEKHYLEAVKFILSCPKLNTFKEDFNGINPLQAALINESTTEPIKLEIKSYMEINQINVIVKREAIDEPSDSEMEIDLDADSKHDIKEEINETELKIMYNKVKNFTPQALDEISIILDRTGSSHHLTELLDLTHLIRNGIFKPNELSKNVLRFAVETNKESLWVIREFLELLGEQDARKIMDEMVSSVYQRM